MNCRSNKQGFALPTILISSAVMLAVLIVTLQAVASVVATLSSQHYSQIARNTAKSGVVMARACLAANFQTVTWTSTNPLTPQTNCQGIVDSAKSAYIYSASGERSTFSVMPPVTNQGSYKIISNASVNLLRSSTGLPWRTFNSTERVDSVLPNIAYIDGGFFHGLAVSSNRTTVFSWGDNTWGQLCDGTTNDLTTPTPVVASGQLDGSYIKQVIGGGEHSLILTDNGNVYACGRNDFGQLGLGDTSPRYIPTQVRTAGTPLATAGPIVAIGAGKFHSIAVGQNGAVYTWGRNDFGQLGIGSAAVGSNRTLAVAVATSGTPMSGKQITAAKSNSNANYVMALDSNGFVYSWGQNGDGKLGDGSTSDRHVPVSLYTAGTGLNGVRVTQLEPETNASFLLGANNKVYVMGGNGTGQFGDPSVPSLWQHQAWEPREMPFSGTPVNGKTVKSISGDGHHGLLVTTDGNVYSWGWNYYGQAGTGSRGPDTCEAANPCVRSLTAVNVSGTLMNGRSITTIATGDRWSYAVATDGTAYAWGHDSGATSAAAMESSRSVEYSGMLGIGPASAASGGTYLDNDTRWIYLKPKQMIFNPVIVAY